VPCISESSSTMVAQPAVAQLRRASSHMPTETETSSALHEWKLSKQAWRRRRRRWRRRQEELQRLHSPERCTADDTVEVSLEGTSHLLPPPLPPVT
jgi:hypothetical protein